MARIVSFVSKAAQEVQNTAKKGAVLKIRKDATEYDDGSIVGTHWGLIALSEINLDSLTDDQKKQWQQALGITGTINTSPPRMVLLDELPSIVRSEPTEIRINIYIDDC